MNIDFLKLDDYDVKINAYNKTYQICYRNIDMQQKLEPKNYNDVLSTLEKINIVLYEKFQNDDGQKEPNKILLKISKDICHYYRSEIASIFNWRYSKKINDVYVKIEALINPQPALPLLNRDIIQVVLSLLHCKDVNRVALFNRDGKLNVDIHIIKRAKDSGYTGLDKAFLAGQYLQSLFNETIEFCNEKLLDAKFFSYKSSNGQTIRSCPEIILNNMKKLPSEQLFQIFCCKKAYDSSHKKVRDFIYIQARGYPISEKQEQFSKEIQKLCSEAMWNACISRELPAVELLFKKGASSDFCGPYLNHNLPAVSIAAYENNMALLKLLLEKGADPNLPASNKSLPLHFAAEKGHLDAVKLLLNNDNMNQIGTHDQTSLHFASIAGKKDVVELLLSYGADLQIQTDYGYTPLHLAAIKGHDDIVKLLLTNGANPNCTADNNRPPMHFAVAAGHCEIVKILLKYKAKLNIVDDDGDTLFHLGAYNGHYKIMELLLKNAVKENINVLNIKRYTPLNLAILQGHVEIVKLLLEHGADVNLQVDGVTALHIATKNSGSPALIELLLNKGGDPNQADIYGTTPLHHAAVEDRGDIALLLLNKEGVDKKNADGMTALSLACSWEKLQFVKILLNYGANINISDNDGNTPLHHAVFKNNSGIIKLLLQKKPDTSLYNNKGERALSVLSGLAKKNIISDEELILSFNLIIFL